MTHETELFQDGIDHKIEVEFDHNSEAHTIEITGAYVGENTTVEIQLTEDDESRIEDEIWARRRQTIAAGGVR